MTDRLKRLATLALLSALLLPGLIFETHAQHAFWAAELLGTRLLVPFAFLTALAWRLTQKPPAEDTLRPGAWLLVALIAWWTLSALANPLRLDLGAGELSEWLSYPMVFAATWWLCGSTRERDKVLAVILLGGVFQAGYGILQSAGHDPFGWSTLWEGRAGGFLGNPNFLGGHLALLLPLALSVSLGHAGPVPRTRPHAKTLAWVAAFIILAGLVSTQTRGAWIGAAAGCLMALWIGGLRTRGLLGSNRKTLWSLALAALMLALAFAARHPQSLKRLSGAFSGDEEVIRRGVLMKAATQLALQHPWFGVGPGQFRIYFPTVQSTGLTPQDYGRRPYISSEHAHNDFIQMAADAGIPALVFYCLLLGWLYWRLWKGSGQMHAEVPLLAGIIGSLAALHVHALANFPFLIAPTQICAWSMAALGLRACQSPQTRDPAPETHLPWTRLKVTAWCCALSVFILGDLVALRLFTEDRLWWVGEGENKLGHYTLSEPQLKKALRLNPREDRLWYQLGLAQLGQHQADQAIQSLKEATRLNGHFTEARITLGKALLELGQAQDAETALLPALADAPNLDDVDEPLAASYFLQKKYEEAVKVYDHALAVNYKPAIMLGNKAAALGNLGYYDQALQALQTAQNLDPGNPDIQVNFAITYLKMGKSTLARQALKRAKELGSTSPQLELIKKAIH